jgi:magnesium chelatase family protein
LAMAIGVLKETGELKEKIPEDSVFIGALSLDGMLPALMAAKSLGFKRVYVPHDPLIPLDMLDGLECIVVQHIHDLL